MSRQIFLCFLAALLLSAPFLEPSLFPTAWVAFVPLFRVIERAPSTRHALFYGWITGFFAHLIGFHWLVYTITVFGGFPRPASVVIFVIYAALQGLQMGLFAVFLRVTGFGPLQIFPALLWIPLEFLFPLLFPWYLANSQVALSWFVQTADLVGPYGASFIVMWFNGAVHRAALSVQRKSLASWLPMAYAALAFIVSLVYGYQRLKSVAEELAGARKLAVGSVQANIDVDLKWNPALAKQNLQKHMSLSEQLDAVPLLIWPESAVEFWIPDDIRVLPLELIPTLKSERAKFFFGARSFRGTFGKPDFKAFNTAFFTDARGRVLGRYHKQVLLAFGEYLPFAKLLSHLPAVPFADGFTPGAGPRVFHLGGGIRVAPLICYEDLMPDLARKFVSETHADILVNLTNDAWYGRSVGPWQHLRLARFRAIETRRSLLRVTNTGVTALVNAKGEVTQSLPTFTAAGMKSEVAILSGETYYVRFGDWFAWGVAAIAAALLLNGLKKLVRPARPL